MFMMSNRPGKKFDADSLGRRSSLVACASVAAQALSKHKRMLTRSTPYETSNWYS
jgi:hypothetical protein